MGVLPAASRQAIPEIFHPLMTDPDSEIIDFYPKDFVVDLNGKKFAWQGVALLPWIDSERLLAAMAKKYPLLSPEVAARNGVGQDVLLFAEAHHDLYADIATNFYSKKQGPPQLKLNPKSSDGLTGKVMKNEAHLPHGSLIFPLSQGAMPNLDEDRSISVHYEMPKSSHIHKSMLLRGVKFALPALTPSEIAEAKGKAARSGRNHGGVPLSGNGRGRNSFNYASSNQYGSSHNNQQPRGDRNGGGYSSNPFPVPPPGWQPPPPGMDGFARGPPPPPPGYGSHGAGQQAYPPPPPQSYGGQYGDQNRYNDQSDHRRGGDAYRGQGGNGNRGRGDPYQGYGGYR